MAINKVVSSDRADQWWLTGPNYGLGTAHDALAQAKAAAKRWADTGERPPEGDQATSIPAAALVI